MGGRNGNAHDLGSRGIGKCSNHILGDTELLTIYNSVLSRWIDTRLVGSQEADMHQPGGQSDHSS